MIHSRPVVAAFLVCLTSLLTGSPGYAVAQSTITISGLVRDADTKSPLAFASIQILKRHEGNVSNDDGFFQLEVREEYTADTLMVSMMGYDPYKAPVGKLMKSNVVIELKARPIQLNEVVISDTKLTAKEIIIKAFQRIETNFPVRPYHYVAFYRETHQQDKRYVMLVEAALDINDNGYKVIRNKRHVMREQVHLKNVRASKNYRDTVFQKTIVERYNLVISALKCNVVKYRNPHFEKGFRDKTVTIDSVLYMNDRLVYVVSFLSYISNFPLFERKNIAYIDAENYAIYKYGWEEYAKKGKYSEPPWRLKKNSFSFVARKRISTIYEYEFFEGKMFLKYFDEKCYDDILDAKGSVQFESLGHTTLIVNGIHTDHINSDKEGRMKHDQSLYTQTTPYDDKFWNNYKQTVPLTNKQLHDLQWELPLTKQFELHTPVEALKK
jgi:hypothetical protein